MRYVAAYMLVALSGEAVTEAAVRATLESVGIDVDGDRLSQVFGELNGKVWIIVFWYDLLQLAT